MHLSFARCFFFYLSFLFPPVEPGVFNCCETTKHPPHLSVQGMHYINFYAAFFSALCRASDSLAYLEHRDSGDRETCGNEQLIELECAGRDVKLLYYLEAFLFAAAR